MGGIGGFFKKVKKEAKRAGKKYGRVLKKVSPDQLWRDTTGKLVHKIAPGAERYLEAGAQFGTQALSSSLGIPPQLTSGALALDHATNAGVDQPLGRAPGELPAGAKNEPEGFDSPGVSISPAWIAGGIAIVAALLLLERRT